MHYQAVEVFCQSVVQFWLRNSEREFLKSLIAVNCQLWTSKEVELFMLLKRCSKYIQGLKYTWSTEVLRCASIYWSERVLFRCDWMHEMVGEGRGHMGIWQPSSLTLLAASGNAHSPTSALGVEPLCVFRDEDSYPVQAFTKELCPCGVGKGGGLQWSLHFAHFNALCVMLE